MPSLLGLIDVPNLPGVPPLPSYAPNNVQLGQALAVSFIGAALPPPWGIYVNGQPLFLPASVLQQTFTPALNAFASVAALLGIQNAVPVFASVVDFEYAADSPISTYPQEQGGFQSYDKVQLPFDVKLRLACDGNAPQRQSFINTLKALRTSLSLVSIVTPEVTFPSCNCVHFDFRRSAANGVSMIVADVWFEQVAVTGSLSFGDSTQQPGDAATQSLGNVQPIPYTGPRIPFSNYAAGVPGIM
jgi:hypothetical protein